MSKKLVLAATILLALLPARAVYAADDLNSVLRKLDAAAANFHTTSADFEFDSITKVPIPDEDIQKGTTYYKREGKTFQMAAHIKEVNGKDVPKVYTYTNGVFQLYEKLPNQVTTLKKLDQYQSWFMLGFGASGKDLEEKWDIKYLGPETIDGKVTQKLQLVAKDATVRKNIPMVTVWMDTDNAVSVKQEFDEGQGQLLKCHYFNIKVNQPHSLPSDAFTLPKLDKQTRFVTQ
jgi:outer membrane lipoprotein-sorting protein